MKAGINKDPGRIVRLLEDDGTFPNNPALPLVVYRGAFQFVREGSPVAMEELFAANRWGGGWRNGIYSFHHYHSTAHEVLAVYGGSARVQLGGEKGLTMEIMPGDVVIIPAGVAHKNLGSGPGFRIVGVYPSGQTWDMNYGKPGERPAADRNIASVPLPQADPVYGEGGFLEELWKL